MHTNLRVEKSDTGLFVCIPTSVAQQYDIAEASTLTLTKLENRAELWAHHYELDELVKQITPENRHLETEW